MNKSSQYNHQSKSEVEEICIYQNLEKWPSQHLYQKINSGFHARKNPKEQYLKAATFRDVSFRH